MYTLDQWLSDRRTERQHQGGGRCPDCAPRAGCLRLLIAVRRRIDHTTTTGIPSGPGRLL
ncbi:hypothetical protein ACN28C_29200 [Plantactinospora sp. WMMC1484]|uniref:hypothetical protein n=1 Tax=Plantactinospora sp. WMMC1484 TaxID=3404122 RepID=UPI003BF56C48